MFWRTKVQDEMYSKEYKQCISDILKLEKAVASQQIEIDAMKQQQKKFEGRFYAKYGKGDENESGSPEDLKNPFSIFGV